MKQKFYTTALEKCFDLDYYDRPSTKSKTRSAEKEFDTFEEASEAAKKTAMQTKDDVVIYKIAGVAKFPIDNITVETVV